MKDHRPMAAGKRPADGSWSTGAMRHYVGAVLRVGLPYAILSGLYVVLSSSLVNSAGISRLEAGTIEIAKGLVFVGLTALLLVGLSGKLALRSHKAAEELNNQKLLSAAVFDALPGPAAVLDRTGRLLVWNRTVESLMSGKDVPGAPVLAQDLVTETDRERVARAIDNILSTGTDEYVVLQFGPAGSRYMVRGVPRYNNAGLIDGIVTVGVDIEPELRLQAQLRASLEGQEAILERTVEAIGRALEARDPYTAGHQSNVAALSEAIGQQLGMDGPAQKGLRVAALIHDIGKLGIPTAILTKPTRLTDEELSLLKTHVQRGFIILRDIPFPWPVAEMVYQHHERLDGSGYPRALSGGQILLEAQILGVADTIEAMSNNRPYRNAPGQEAAFGQLRRGAGVRFSPEVVEACVAVFHHGFRFPESSLAT